MNDGSILAQSFSTYILQKKLDLRAELMYVFHIVDSS